MNPLRDTLFNTAIREIWANPQADNNAVFKTTMITSRAGITGQINFPFMSINLPDNKTCFIVVQLGNVPTNLVGLITNLGEWSSLRSVCNDLQVLIQPYIQGRLISLKGSYIKIRSDGNVILAFDYRYIKRLLAIEDDIYIRIYNNLVYDGNIQTNKSPVLSGTYIVTKDKSAYGDFKTSLDFLNNQLGGTLQVFRNGIFIPDGLGIYGSVTKGDIIDYIADPYLVAKDIFVIAEQPNYLSDYDGLYKVLVSVDDLANEVYVDDIECYITGYNSNGHRVGVHYPKIQASDIRMITYKDWSISSSKIDARFQDMYLFSDIGQTLTDLQIHLYRRYTGHRRTMFLDSNYMMDLMNLPVDVRLLAMLGGFEDIPFWNINVLEQSSYITWISKPTIDLDSTNVTGVFSRHGVVHCTESIRKLPYKTQWSLPPSAKNGGLLLHYPESVVTLKRYSEENHAKELFTLGTGCEAFFPKADIASPLDIILENGNGSDTWIDDDFEVFCYYLHAGNLHMAILGTDYTLVPGNHRYAVVWNEATYAYKRYIRTSNVMVHFTKSIDLLDIVKGIDVYGGRLKAHHVGMGSLMVWYNNRYLVEGLDYTLLNTKIYITSKPPEWVDSGIITVIYAGLPNSSLHHTQNNNWGFIKFGSIYNDSNYDLYMYRNKLFFIGGKPIPFNELRSVENYRDKENAIQTIHEQDGMPYAVVDPIIFSRASDISELSLSKTDTEIKETAIANFINLAYPQQLSNRLMTIPRKYELVSLFMNKAIEAIVNNSIDVIEGVVYTENMLLDDLSLYTHFLPIDPCLSGHDTDFTQISPRWTTDRVTITSLQFDYLKLINELILDNKVDGLSLYFNIIT